MINVEQLKNSVNRMSVDVVREAVLELRLDGLVTEGKPPLTNCISIPVSPKSKPCSSARVITGSWMS